MSPLPHDSVICLTNEEKESPGTVFQVFFEHFHLHEAKQDLAACIQVSITSDNTTYDTGTKRSNLIFLQEQLNRLIEAAYLLKTNNPSNNG